MAAVLVSQGITVILDCQSPFQLLKGTKREEGTEDQKSKETMTVDWK